MSPHREIGDLLVRNRAWAERVRKRDPGFFDELADQQAPRFLWIGCSDSRVPSTEIVDLAPGEMFVHRNIANQVIPTDLNCLSVIQYAVDVLQVEHVIVCGHFCCGGVRAALSGQRVGLCDVWLKHIQDIAERHRERLPADQELAADYLCKLNVIEQVVNACHTVAIQDAWARGQSLAVHGWIYGVGDGLLEDLGVSIAGPEEIESAQAAAFGRLAT